MHKEDSERKTYVGTEIWNPIEIQSTSIVSMGSDSVVIWLTSLEIKNLAWTHTGSWEEKIFQRKPVIDLLNIAPGHEMEDILYYEKEIDEWLQNRFIILCLTWTKQTLYTVSFIQFHFFILFYFEYAFYSKIQCSRTYHPLHLESHRSYYGSKTGIPWHHSQAMVIPHLYPSWSYKVPHRYRIYCGPSL